MVGEGPGRPRVRVDEWVGGWVAWVAWVAWIWIMYELLIISCKLQCTLANSGHAAIWPAHEPSVAPPHPLPNHHTHAHTHMVHKYNVAPAYAEPRTSVRGLESAMGLRVGNTGAVLNLQSASSE